jgi:hypothetical protein
MGVLLALTVVLYRVGVGVAPPRQTSPRASLSRCEGPSVGRQGLSVS